MRALFFAASVSGAVGLELRKKQPSAEVERVVSDTVSKKKHHHHHKKNHHHKKHEDAESVVAAQNLFKDVHGTAVAPAAIKVEASKDEATKTTKTETSKKATVPDTKVEVEKETSESEVGVKDIEASKKADTSKPAAKLLPARAPVVQLSHSTTATKAAAKKPADDFDFVHDENETYDHSWPALDASSADFVTDDNGDQGQWASLTKYDQFRHKIVGEKNQVLKDKEVVDFHASEELEARDALEDKRSKEQELSELVDEKKTFLEAALDDLNVVRQRTLAAKRQLSEKRKMLDALEEERARMEKEFNEKIEAEKKKVMEAEEHYDSTKIMVEDTQEFDQKNKIYEALRAEHAEVLAAHKEALKAEEAAEATYEAKRKALEEAQKKLAKSQGIVVKTQNDLSDARHELGKYPSSDTNPWTDRMGGVMQEPELHPGNGKLHPDVIWVMSILGVVAVIGGTGYFFVSKK